MTGDIFRNMEHALEARELAEARYVWIMEEMAINPQLKLKDFEVI